MALFTRRTPRDTNALYAALTHGTFTEMEQVYEPAWVNYEFESGTPLTLALTHKDTDQRVAHREPAPR